MKFPKLNDKTKKDILMMNFLASKNFSLFCALLNLGVAGYSVYDGAYGWAFFASFFAWFCYGNYLNASEHE